jgi:hypothetical protein
LKDVKKIDQKIKTKIAQPKENDAEKFKESKK